jgi:hypothetical protein
MKSILGSAGLSFVTAFALAETLVSRNFQFKVGWFHFHHSYLGLILLAATGILYKLKDRQSKISDRKVILGLSAMVGFALSTLVHHQLTEGFILKEGWI